MPRLSLLTLLCLAAGPALAGGVSMPPQFDGTYAPEGVPCDSALVLQVAGDTILGGDGAMEVTDLIEVPGDPNTVEVSLIVSGGGGSWAESAVMTLAGDGQSLRLVYPDGGEVTWARCG